MPALLNLLLRLANLEVEPQRLAAIVLHFFLGLIAALRDGGELLLLLRRLAVPLASALPLLLLLLRLRLAEESAAWRLWLLLLLLLRLDFAKDLATGWGLREHLELLANVGGLGFHALIERLDADHRGWHPVERVWVVIFCPLPLALVNPWVVLQHAALALRLYAVYVREGDGAAVHKEVGGKAHDLVQHGLKAASLAGLIRALHTHELAVPPRRGGGLLLLLLLHAHHRAVSCHVEATLLRLAEHLRLLRLLRLAKEPALLLLLLLLLRLLLAE
mmetsp:Transcript_13006/g.36636  ORF Transcript_13006/g.36636 Transcript_13006/m.36636 type:complete len:275 (+) Transcript_13006:445-1269(+)